MKFFKKLIDLLFPERLTCNICGKEVFDDAYLCDECAKDFKLNDGYTCPVCGRKTNLPQICLECKDRPPLFKRAVSALVYEGNASKLIIAFKNGKTYHKRYFAELLAEKCRQFEDADSLCFVPMTEKAVRKRGYNQSELLAKELSEKLGLPLLKNAVVKNRETESQKTLSYRERAENLKGCFTAYKGEVNGRSIILVDDVFTTGATAEAVIKELLKKGAKCVYLATIASVEYKIPL